MNPELINTVNRIICESLGIEDITKRTRKTPYPLARQVAAYWLCNNTKLSLRNIANSVGLGQHDLVLYSKKQIEKELEWKSDRTKQIRLLLDRLNNLERVANMLIVVFKQEPIHRKQIDSIRSEFNTIESARIVYFFHSVSPDNETTAERLMIEIDPKMHPFDYDNLVNSIKANKLVEDVKPYYKH